MLARKDKIMGFGHAIYSESDPRNTIIKLWAEKLAAEVGDTDALPGIRALRGGYVAREEAVLQRRFLPCLRLSLHGNTDQAIYSYLRDVSAYRLGGPR